MKKEYLRPDTLDLVLTAGCLQDPIAAPGAITSANNEGGFVPARRAGSPDGPAGL